MQKKSRLYRSLFKGNPMENSKLTLFIPYMGEISKAIIESKVSFDYSKGLILNNNKYCEPRIILDKNKAFYPEYNMEISGYIAPDNKEKVYITGMGTNGNSYIHRRNGYVIDNMANEILLGLLHMSDLFPLVLNQKILRRNEPNKGMIDIFSSSRVINTDFSRGFVIKKLIDNSEIKDLSKRMDYFGLTEGIYRHVMLIIMDIIKKGFE